MCSTSNHLKDSVSKCEHQSTFNLCNIFFVYEYLLAYMYACASRVYSVHRDQERASDLLGTGVMGDCNPPYVGASN